MASLKMVTIVTVILISTATITVVSATARFIISVPSQTKPQKLATCLLLGQPCMKSKDLCCTLIYQKTFMRLQTVPATCFKFGKGICQVNQSIENLEGYIKLVEQLNNTNFQELKNKYWSSIPVTYTCPKKMIIELTRE